MNLTISRRDYCLDSKLYPDCRFLVGGDCADVEEEICGHKMIFASVSSVFKNMFLGRIPEEGDIIIPDIRPEIFHEMVNFFYTGTITIGSVEQAIDLYYVADKYNIEDLLNRLPDYIISNITPQNVCSVLQFPILHSNEIVKRKCQEIIKTEISSVLNGSSFLEADFSTLSFIFDQEDLNVPEIELFRALVRYENARKNKIDDVKSEQLHSTSPATSWSVEPEVKRARISENVDSCGEEPSNQEDTTAPGSLKENEDNPVKQLMKKIRFLTMTAKEFAECVGMSSFLSTSEVISIFVNISDPTNLTHPMPEEFSTTDKKRSRKMFSWVNHAIEKSGTHRCSSSYLRRSLLFKCSAKIKITGIKLNLCSITFSDYFTMNVEIINESNERLFHEHVLVDLDRNDEINQSPDIPLVLHDPVYIDRGRYYTIKVRLHNFDGEILRFKKYSCSSTVTVDNVTLHFGRNSSSCKCKGIIRTIVFTNCE